ncbi:putative MFS family arabinose efflux permease [Streptomyces sp. Ag109_O5-1]|uniref:MFS transporter n=1 Tax=Streptomyces sp. Ag109_O5-1 TaxID=1938851 RepID=UPI000F4FB559|nr:MFS transporter [Streptomyces sp. Ag109_O5-1]RPE45412.1 putative MFS family arabinose efflux permease [Streptomyces sp. Ag109_O5-1]
MNHPAPHERTERTTARRKPIPPRAAFYVLASVVVSFLAASSAPTPLYATYQAEWGFTPITTTVVFGVYAIAVLSGLLVLGKLSDHVGRRPVLITAIAAQAAAMVMFSTAGGVGELLAARVVQGLSTGAALGAVGAAMMDINRSRGTVANAFAPGLGTATGALLSGLVVQYLPAPTHTIYLGLLGVFAVQAVALALIDETVTKQPGALASLVPEIRLPRPVRGAALAAAPVVFAVWALAGFYGSLGPALVRALVGSTSAVYGGLGLFVLAFVSAASVLALRKAAATTVMYTGIGALVAGVALTLVAVATSTPALFFVGTAVAGVGFGSGFQGGIRTVLPLTRPHESSGVLSLLFVVAYLGMGVPSVVAGALVVHGGGLLPTSEEYGTVVIALALLALAALLLRGRPQSAPGVKVASGGVPAERLERVGR